MNSLFPLNYAKTSGELFQQLGLDEFTLEELDPKGKRFYYFIEICIRGITPVEKEWLDNLSLAKEEQYKDWLKTLKRKDTQNILKEYSDKQMFVLFGSRLINWKQIIDNLVKINRRSQLPEYPKGQINLHKGLLPKIIPDFFDWEKIIKSPLAIDIIRSKYQGYNDIQEEFFKLLFFLQSIQKDWDVPARRKYLEKAGLDILNLETSAKHQFNLIQKGKHETIPSAEINGAQYYIFIFHHKDGNKSVYKELCSQMHSKNNSSYHSRSDGERIALQKLRNISVSTSEIIDLINTFINLDSKKNISHTEFDSNIKFFFIPEYNLLLNDGQNNNIYENELSSYFGEEIGNRLYNMINKAFKNNHQNLDLYNQIELSEKVFEEFDDEKKLQGRELL